MLVAKYCATELTSRLGLGFSASFGSGISNNNRVLVGSRPAFCGCACVWVLVLNAGWAWSGSGQSIFSSLSVQVCISEPVKTSNCYIPNIMETVKLHFNLALSFFEFIACLRLPVCVLRCSSLSPHFCFSCCLTYFASGLYEHRYYEAILNNRSFAPCDRRTQQWGKDAHTQIHPHKYAENEGHCWREAICSSPPSAPQIYLW